ncbi:ParA family protein [Pedobacter paludis]|uniref:ParA family protein n=2 Tax=Pedobacter paludis TaxID=2203212 RepID=A0A317F1L1_9SPHI|nr:ParA family protein [Pedobacter paludis]
MVILLGNQKGGAGKSTLTLLLANYLSLVRKKKVTVLDMDYQASISAKAEKSKVPENEGLYEVIPCDLKIYPAVFSTLKSNTEELVIIDMPGKMDDDGLIPAILSADLILCPFNYDEFSVDSTLLFAMVCSKLNMVASRLFIPNRIKTTVKYETKLEVDNALRKFGSVSPAIPDRIDFQRLTTSHIPLAVLPVVIPILDLVFESYIMKGKSG